MGVPSFRGIVCHGGLATMRAAGPLGLRAIAELDPSHLDRIERTSKLGWVPAECLHALNLKYFALAGEQDYLALWRDYTAGSHQESFFQGLYASALRIFGRTPVGLVRWMGRAWEVTTREHGQVVVEDDGDGVRVRLLGCPPAVRVPTLPLTMQATVQALIALGGGVPQVELDADGFERTGACAIAGRWLLAEHGATVR
ncbi:MAG: hypothetical protein K1X88_30915 [Nannocystaceae bacterium]|nr:hypothetical protein [Nannocystaceae bacterium]